MSLLEIIEYMKKYILILIALFSILTITSQEVEKDTIGTEEINIVKPYSPKIKDAFKVKKSPKQGEDAIKEKKEVEYSINSVPVASTFTPAKGKAKGVTRKKRERIYDNYASVGFGNYTTPKIEVFAHTSTTRDNEFGGTLNFHSSNGDIKDIKLDTDFMQVGLDLFYKNSSREMDWQVNGEYNYQKQNWYGLHNPDSFSEAQIDLIDEKQVYNTIRFGGNIDYYDSYFKGAKADVHIFTDAYKSSEFQIVAVPKFEFPLSTELLNTDVRLEFIGGNFDKNYITDDSINYGFYNLGVSPNFKVLRDYFTFNLGANLVYSGAVQENAKSKFYIYPNVTASYELIPDVMTLYAGVTGNLHQQSYRKFAEENPFVSPTLDVRRTDEQYNAKFGAKGKLASYISYNLNASYKSENDKAFYQLNDDLTNNATTRNYQYANSFNVVHDDVKTFSVFGELIIDFTKEISFGGNATFNSYNLDLQDEAWNLPNLKASVFANYNTKKWLAGAKLFFVSEREDQYVNSLVFIPISDKIINKSYIDLNLNLGYNFTDRLTAFINGNNLFSTNYQKFTNYKVQGIQVLGGIKYKFDL